jgi:hypothetical protein
MTLWPDCPVCNKTVDQMSTLSQMQGPGFGIVLECHGQKAEVWDGQYFCDELGRYAAGKGIDPLVSLALEKLSRPQNGHARSWAGRRYDRGHPMTAMPDEDFNRAEAVVRAKFKRPSEAAIRKAAYWMCKRKRLNPDGVIEGTERTMLEDAAQEIKNHLTKVEAAYLASEYFADHDGPGA